MEQRIIRSRPKLSDILEHFRTHFKGTHDKKKKITALLQVMYSFSNNKIEIKKDWTDLKFEKLTSLINRINRMVNINVPTINDLITQVDKLQDRFDYRTNNVREFRDR